MKHYVLSDDLRARLLESADWGSINVTLAEAKEKLAKKDEVKPEVKAQEAPVQEDETSEDEELDALVEQALHTCPLCLTEMEETLDEDRILEHLDVAAEIIERVNLLNEEDENIEDLLSEALSSLFLQTIDFGDESDEDDEV